MRQEVKQREDRLAFMAHHDNLTELPSRILFRKRVKRLLEAPGSEQRSFAIIIVGLDRFKEINDTYGYKVGDKVLCLFADILKHIVAACNIASLDSVA